MVAAGAGGRRGVVVRRGATGHARHCRWVGAGVGRVALCTGARETNTNDANKLCKTLV